MKLIGEYGKDDLAKVYIAAMRESNQHLVEFVESTQPPLTMNDKWVLIVSSLYGCPVQCQMCDAGGDYYGKLTTEEILEQIDYLVSKRFPDKRAWVNVCVTPDLEHLINQHNRVLVTSVAKSIILLLNVFTKSNNANIPK